MTLAGPAVLSVLAAGCSTPAQNTPATQPVADKPVRKGGGIVIGAEQEPDCTDWIATCGGSIWGTYMMHTTTIPGINFMRTKVTGLDDLLDQVATELDEQARKAASVKADELIAAEVPSIPMSAVPTILLWSGKVGGPISINPAEGPWWNLEQWGLAQ
ncbi:hypothetical protein [Acrocarpospora catenulata]|uniref:hypothetical protein n=1 Tax=Acrocarpospora catenulata TaxID=2836182 RepID=UPI001BD943AA|nr:hypothetical protein [Acrocarpospora catenulata]